MEQIQESRQPDHAFLIYFGSVRCGSVTTRIRDDSDPWFGCRRRHPIAFLLPHPHDGYDGGTMAIMVPQGSGNLHVQVYKYRSNSRPHDAGKHERSEPREGKRPGQGNYYIVPFPGTTQ